MPSPFPGMNPYLEHPDRWSTVHNRLIVALADFLTPQLLPKYQVDIEKRIYEIVGVNSLLVGKPDVTVQSPRHPTPRLSPKVMASVAAAEPIEVRVPMLEEVREAYLEVKEAATQLVVTAIKILSPTNKRGEGRRKYEQKRQQVLNSRTHLVEIDLLREGEPLALADSPVASSYRILVSRSQTRPLAALYAFNLAQRIPAFPLPLQPEDEEPFVNLQSLLNEVYERSGYDYFIDYQSDPLPPLTEAELNWLDSLLRTKGLR